MYVFMRPSTFRVLPVYSSVRSCVPYGLPTQIQT